MVADIIFILSQRQDGDREQETKEDVTETNWWNRNRTGLKKHINFISNLYINYFIKQVHNIYCI